MMKLFSVLPAEQPMIERLLDLHRHPLRQRRGLIKSLEADGYTVDFVRGKYYARSASHTYQTPERRCPHCRKVQILAAFLTMRDVEHPWCQTCRHYFPVEAERARAERDYYADRGDYDIRANERCANPECGSIIPARKLQAGAKFCSRDCFEAVKYGPERLCPHCEKRLDKDHTQFCSKECRIAALYKKCGYSQCHKLIRPSQEYCDKECMTLALMEVGFYHEISELGNESQFVYKAVHHEVPQYPKRRDAVAESNHVNPRRKRKELRGG